MCRVKLPVSERSASSNRCRHVLAQYFLANLVQYPRLAHLFIYSTYRGFSSTLGPPVSVPISPVHMSAKQGVTGADEMPASCPMRASERARCFRAIIPKRPRPAPSSTATHSTQARGCRCAGQSETLRSSLCRYHIYLHRIRVHVQQPAFVTVARKH
jgi:hypothetical protein